MGMHSWSKFHKPPGTMVELCREIRALPHVLRARVWRQHHRARLYLELDEACGFKTISVNLRNSNAYADAAMYIQDALQEREK